jgi:hypothetical protein
MRERHLRALSRGVCKGDIGAVSDLSPARRRAARIPGAEMKVLLPAAYSEASQSVPRPNGANLLVGREFPT